MRYWMPVPLKVFVTSPEVHRTSENEALNILRNVSFSNVNG